MQFQSAERAAAICWTAGAHKSTVLLPQLLLLQQLLHGCWQMIQMGTVGLSMPMGLSLQLLFKGLQQQWQQQEQQQQQCRVVMMMLIVVKRRL
jgi:hypothetical protein